MTAYTFLGTTPPGQALPEPGTPPAGQTWRLVHTATFRNDATKAADLALFWQLVPVTP